MIKCDFVTKENMKEHNRNWPQVPHHPYIILIIADSGSGKTNSLFNLINEKQDIDKISLCTKDPHLTKYQFLINKKESTDILVTLKFLLNTRMI